MKKTSDYLTADAEPDACSMIETFRAIGYSIETAVADILDNSISAEARNIWIDYEWDGSESILMIKDDGHGMDNNEIIQAMRPGSKHPLEKRDAKDLGRFGMGLKTSSFSQSRRFTLLSKRKSSEVKFWAWDLDHVDFAKSWQLIHYTPRANCIDELNDLVSGTIVIWYDIDRLFKGKVSVNDQEALGKFMEIMELVKVHLAVVFHRYLEQKKVRIHFQGRKLEAWDPFLRGEKATQTGPDEYIHEGKVKIKGYVLPHKSKISEVVFRQASGPRGWNAHQGFYIYRNERLLVSGDWLGLYKKEEHYKLARIMIDLPNDLDDDWQIDIKKSVARPPLLLKRNLKAYSDDIRAKAVEVYRHKGKVLQRKHPSMKYVPVWFEKQRHGKRYYSLNKEHPVLKPVLKKYKSRELSEALRFVEETVPVPLITIRESEQPESHGLPFEGVDHEYLISKLKELFELLICQGKDPEEAAGLLLTMDPFDRYPQYIELLLENHD